MLKNKPEEHWKETIRTKGFGENTIFTCFGYKWNIKKDIFRAGRHYERGFCVLLCQRIWGLRQVILQIGTSISLKTSEICLAEKSLVCSWLHLREKIYIYIYIYFGFVAVTSLTLFLFPHSDDSFADREIPETVMSIDQYLIISQTMMMQQYS